MHLSGDRPGESQKALDGKKEIWHGEDQIFLGDIPEAFWSDAARDATPRSPPEASIDELADKVEIQRLCQWQADNTFCQRLEAEALWRPEGHVVDAQVTFCGA